MVEILHHECTKTLQLVKLSISVFLSTLLASLDHCQQYHLRFLNLNISIETCCLFWSPNTSVRFFHLHCLPLPSAVTSGSAGPGGAHCCSWIWSWVVEWSSQGISAGLMFCFKVLRIIGKWYEIGVGVVFSMEHWECFNRYLLFVDIFVQLAAGYW